MRWVDGVRRSWRWSPMQHILCRCLQPRLVPIPWNSKMTSTPVCRCAQAIHPCAKPREATARDARDRARPQGTCNVRRHPRYITAPIAVIPLIMTIFQVLILAVNICILALAAPSLAWPSPLPPLPSNNDLGTNAYTPFNITLLGPQL